MDKGIDGHVDILEGIDGHVDTEDIDGHVDKEVNDGHVDKEGNDGHVDTEEHILEIVETDSNITVRISFSLYEDRLKKRINQKNNLLLQEKEMMMACLMEKMKVGGKLQHGALGQVAQKFNCSRQVVSKLWKRAKSMQSNALSTQHVGHTKKDRSGIVVSIKDVPFNQRTTIRSLAHAISVPPATVHHLLSTGEIQRKGSSIKPSLTAKNKLSRLQYCLKLINHESGQFHHFHDTVHIDEKWFNITKVRNSYILIDGETAPHRHFQHKSHITKVMFMAAVSHPRYDFKKKKYFSGRLGIWPFVEIVPAKRTSKNRVKGTPEMKFVNVNRLITRKMLMDHVFPAIREQFPRAVRWTKVYVQKDNAGPHLYSDDKEIQNELDKDGIKIVLTRQPPNSPDFNVLDLGFFNSIQSLQNKIVSKNIEKFVSAPKTAFEMETAENLENVWVSYQKEMESSMIVHG